jgi:hypothetical protein
MCRLAAAFGNAGIMYTAVMSVMLLGLALSNARHFGNTSMAVVRLILGSVWGGAYGAKFRSNAICLCIFILFKIALTAADCGVCSKNIDGAIGIISFAIAAVCFVCAAFNFIVFAAHSDFGFRNGFCDAGIDKVSIQCRWRFIKFLAFSSAFGGLSCF